MTHVGFLGADEQLRRVGELRDLPYRALGLGGLRLRSALKTTRKPDQIWAQKAAEAER